MTITRVATYATHQSTMADVMRLQSKLANLQNQQSSGYKSDNFQGLSGQVESFVQFEAKINKTNTLIQNNTLIISRMQTTDVALEQIISVASDFQDLLVLRGNPTAGDNLQFAISAESMLETLANQLNTSQEGRYLFAGTRTNTPPVIEPIPNPVVSGMPDDSYYQGNDVDLYARVQENYDVQYNVRANEDAFQKLFAAIDLGLRADAESNDTLLSEATQMANEALEGIIAIRARVQQNIVNVEEINERHEQLNLYWKGLTEKIIKTDILSTSTEIALSQATLQASFMSFTQLNQLRLTDFLR